ncbi:branched-chain amino acid ABC transporter ATP-binding protein [Haladaptatus paucihalophilus DX253]|uniref:Probable branched-chain amino acid transport ATP-binding protein LivG n=1 Tax=Haladaptatus paucihalophilus DX253 TaxID=797209 RepID=E7QPJ8_HALPU|nr:ABC transporter ATP-binding protein [Haladaptatus paucihalophilus]EFW93481.1 branched-chain amino acid ABC transporter ATP-binding protein [Haladaptatus paucihalophilus DX253]SHL20271.1 amino acid/amide ABC transporter ATP-binding protein 1, HAAT family [Haladaptatus paucihalophilus DX253]
MALLETTDLTRQFGNLVATDDVNLAVEAGEFRSVIGPNGAGKTTLFNLISGALFPTSGTITFAGEDVSRLPPHERVRQGIGRSFQITTVFSGLSVRENVRLAAQSGQRFSPRQRLFHPTDDFPAVEKRVEEVLSQIGLTERADERASALAYGDRRRLEIGLVLATDPRVVLLDEPTAGMSVEETRATMELIDDVLADRTVLLIEHDIDLVMNVSDRITVLNRGRELATGTPAQVAANDEVQAAYLGGVRT